MHFRAATSLAVLAYAAAAVAQGSQPYRRAVMPLPGMGLMRRDTDGYKPELQSCTNPNANTCAEACGPGYDECATRDGTAHCFNKAKGDTCCMDGSGNACETGHYCTHDNSKQNWCCPQAMDLAACAAAYSVAGGLNMATPSAAPSTHSKFAPPAPSTTVASSSSSPTTSSTPKPTPTTTSTPSSSSSRSIALATESTVKNSTVRLTSSSYSTPWSSLNSTSTSTSTRTSSAPTQPSGALPSVMTSAPAPTNVRVNSAAAPGVSALLLVAAAAVALL